MEIKTEDLVKIVEIAVESHSDDVYYNHPKLGEMYFDSCLFPVGSVGQYCFYLKQLSENDRKSFIRHGFLPEHVMYPVLKQIGIGRKYYPCDLSLFDKNVFKEICGCVRELLNDGCRGLLIMGDPGTGKTTIMRYIIERLVVGSECRIQPGQLLFLSIDRLYEAIFDRNDKIISRIRSVKYLFIDDLGQAYESEFACSKFESIMSDRYNDLLPTFFTTNKTVSELKDNRAMRRLYDRLRDRDWIYATLQVCGESMRGEKQITNKPERSSMTV